MVGSSLVTKQIALTSGFTKNRSGKTICRFTPHHAAGNSTVEGIASTLTANGTSATYGIQDKNIAQYISEEYRPWTSASPENDNQAITVEVSNRSDVTTKNGDSLGWPISDESLESLIKLGADVMQRNGIAPLVVGENLTWHSMFKATICPGPYLLGQMQYIADACNSLAFGDLSNASSGKVLYGVVKQVIALTEKANAEKYAAQLNKNVSNLDTEYYKVIEINA